MAVSTALTHAVAKVDASVSTDKAFHDLSALDSMTGKWEPFSASKNDSIVNVNQTLLSGSPRDPTQMHPGTRGTVSHFDSDGGAIIYFPQVVQEGGSDSTLVFREDLRKLVCLSLPES